MISVKEVYELLIMIHDILDSVVSTWVGNSTLFLASLLILPLGSELHNTPFFSFKSSGPPSEACLYGHINWSLVQAQQQSSLDLFESSISMRGGRTRPWAGFQFNVQKQPMAESSGGSVAKRPY